LYKRSIFGVIPDNMGNLWLSSDVGIIKYNIKNDETVYFGKADGLLNNEFATTAKFKDKSGNIYFGGSKGIVSFNPLLMKPNTIHSKPVITNFLVQNKVISPGDSLHGRILLEKQVWEINEIELRHDEADFTIEFSALHYSAPEKNQFQYKLEGFNKDWVYTNAEKRYASYTGLPPGNYTFILKTTNNDGLLCDEKDDVRLKIAIVPAFWQTLWFQLLVFLIIAGSISFLITNRMLTLRRMNKTLDVKIKERTSELENVNKFLEERTIELEEVNTILEDRQEEINLQKDEIVKQLEELKEQQAKIIDQNAELDKHRNHLETLVEERTIELEEALKKAEQSDKLKTSFLTNMSHEIRTPMNAILGFSKLIQGNLAPEKREKFINIIDTNGKLLLTLINDILDLSSIQSQHVSLKPMQNNLYNALLKVYDIFKAETKNKKIAFALKTNGLDKNLEFDFDEIRLKQVIINLISNAIKFTEQGTIEFGVMTIDEKATFFVKDSGIGIDKSFGDSIFDRFFKIETNKSQLYRGTGLGLAICKSIVKLWNGDIWYESEIGVGTTFYFTMPIIKSTESITETSANPIILLDLSGVNILVAEDEASNFILVEDYLAETNAKITWVKNGADAVEMTKSGEYNLVLMDIKMPILDGMEAARRIKAIQPELPIIALTAFAFKNEIEDILRSGMDTYLIKPIEKQDLFLKISYYI
jgi:signal transduction histidine kinase